MATFGPIASAFAPPNALLDIARQDVLGTQLQRNRLAMLGDQQDLADRQAIRALGPGLAQQSDAALGQLTAINPTMGAQVGAAWALGTQRRAEHFQRDNQARLQLAQQFYEMPEDQAAAAWPAERARMQAAGLGLDLPEAFPGRARMEAVVRGGLPMMERLRMQALERLDLGDSGGGAAPAGGGDQPRGLRNNNPLNIEAGGFAQRQVGFAGSDGRFARFENMEQGMQAADQLLQSYAQRGLVTPAAIIGRWAPASDGNNVSAYAAAVARDMGVRPDQPLDMGDPAVRRRLAEAMAKHENGRPLPAAGQGAVTPASLTTPAASGGGGLTEGLTPEQVQTLRTMRAAPGADVGGIARQAQTYREQNRQAARQAEADQRAQQRADQQARGTAPAGYRMAADGNLEFIPGGPADPEVMKRTAGNRGGRVLPTGERTALVESSQRLSQLERLGQTFQPDFGGFGAAAWGDLRNAIARNTPGESPRADWWQGYQSLKNVVRNEMFGAALTATEKAEFEKADINPGMSPETIRNNLARQQQIVRQAINRRARSLRADGYNELALEEATGLTFADAQPAGDGPAADTPAPAQRPAAGGMMSGADALAAARQELGPGASDDALVERARAIRARSGR